MLNDLYLKLALIFTGVVLVKTLILGGLLALFQPGERGFFARHGQVAGWGVCFGVTLALSAMSLASPLAIEGGFASGHEIAIWLGLILWIMSIVSWWVFALAYLGLTLRQTLKLYLAMDLIVLGLIFGIAAIV